MLYVVLVLCIIGMFTAAFLQLPIPWILFVLADFLTLAVIRFDNKTQK